MARKLLQLFALTALVLGWVGTGFAGLQAGTHGAAQRRPCTSASESGELASNHFQVLCPGDEEGTWRDLGAILEESYQAFHGVFESAGFPLAEPPAKLVWRCFADRGDYERYCAQTEGSLAWLDSQYCTRTNCVVLLQEWRGRDAAFDRRQITHEIAHQLAFNCGLMQRGVYYPFWLAEGLATNLEHDALDGGERLHATQLPANPERHRDLVSQVRTGACMPLADFVGLVSLPSGGRPSAAALYDEAWGLFRFLLLQEPEQLQAYLAGMREDPPRPGDTEALRAGFARAFGDPSELEGPWRRFLLRQRLPECASATVR